jgi:hypothetical protein
MLSVRLFGSQFPRAYVGSTPVRAAGLLVCVGQVAGLRCTPCGCGVWSSPAATTTRRQRSYVRSFGLAWRVGRVLCRRLVVICPVLVVGCWVRLLVGDW